MARERKTIQTRVCIDDMLGPFDCELDPAFRWNGWLSPSFTLDVTRELSTQTLNAADEYGYECTDTIHVIDGRADSADTVHIIQGDRNPYSEDHEMMEVAVRIRWKNVERDAVEAATISKVTPKDRKAARRRKVTGRGAKRAVVIHIRWQWLSDDSDTAATAVRRGRDGLYSIGGWEWTWHFASWWCACSEGNDWHEPNCSNCHRTKDNQEQPAPCDCGCDVVKEGIRETADLLRQLVPNATAAGLIVEDGHPRLISVAAGRRLVWTDDDQDSGPFDYERIGGADVILHHSLIASTGPESLRLGGWNVMENSQGLEAYSIQFPPLLSTK